MSPRSSSAHARAEPAGPDAPDLTDGRAANRPGPDESAERLRATLASLGDLVFVLDRGGVFEACHQPPGAQLLALPPEDFLGKSYRAVGLPAALVRQFDDALAAVLETGKTEKLDDYTLDLPTGGRCFSARVAPRHGSDGAMTGFTVVVRDVTEYRQAAAEARAAEEQLRTIVDNVSDVVTIIGTDGAIRWESPAAERITGFAAGERIGRNALEYIHPDDLGRVTEALTELVQAPGATRSAEFRHRLVDGSWRWAESVATNLLDRPGIEGIVVVTRDIGERKEAEAALAASEERFRLLAENARDVIFRVRLQPEFAFEYMSPSVTELTGYTPEEHYADPELFHRTAHPDDLGSLAAAFTTAPGQPAQFRIVRKDGGIVWAESVATVALDANGEVVALEGVVRDVTERKEQQELLQRYGMLVEQTRDRVFVLDAQGRILDVNQAAVEAYGYSRDELLAMTVADLRTDAERPHAAAQLEEAVESGRLYDTVHCRKDGTATPVEISARGAKVDGQTLILTIARDISERKQAERALAESEERHRTLIENISDVVTILNPDGTIRYESPSIERSLGYRPDELVGRVGFELVHPDDLDRVLAEFAAKIGVPGDRTVIRFRFRHADGSWRVLEALATNRVDDPAVHGMVVVSRDVTGQEEMQAALRESEERFRRAFDDAAAGMALVAPDGRFVRANEALCAITGRDEAELLALTFQDITHPDDLQADLDLLEQTLAGAIDSYQMEKRYIHKQGHEVWILLTVSLIRDEAGEPLYFVSQIEDITARKHAEQEHDRLLLELADQNERLQALDRRKDEIVSVVSHDLRTPLTSIIGYLDLVLEQHPDDEEGRFLAVARRNADRLLKIVTDLLLISRAQSRRLQLDLGTVDLLRLAAETAQGLEPRASAGGVRIAVTGKPVSIVADEARLAEVLENLISNAVKFTPQDGRVEVRLGPADGGGAVLEVADTGIGIPEDEQQYLFEQFFRASTAGGQSTEGAGLGLAICKAVVDAHGGEIEVDSEPERGTTFRVLLPARPPLPA